MRLRVLALVLVALLAQGCFVFDELDKGSAEIDAHMSKQGKAKLAAEKAGTQNAKDKKDSASPKEQQKSWWSNATSLSTADQAPKEDPHVRCRIDKKERFMLQSDCATQGGKVVTGS